MKPKISALRTNAQRLREVLENEGCIVDMRDWSIDRPTNEVFIEMKVHNNKNNTYFEIECTCKNRKEYIKDWHNPIKEMNHPVYEFCFFWSFKAGVDFTRHDNLYIHSYKEAEAVVRKLTKINTALELRNYIDEMKKGDAERKN